MMLVLAELMRNTCEITLILTIFDCANVTDGARDKRPSACLGTASDLS